MPRFDKNEDQDVYNKYQKDSDAFTYEFIFESD